MTQPGRIRRTRSSSPRRLDMTGLALLRQKVRRRRFDNRQLAEEAGGRTVSRMASAVERLREVPVHLELGRFSHRDRPTTGSSSATLWLRTGRSSPPEECRLSGPAGFCSTGTQDTRPQLRTVMMVAELPVTRSLDASPCDGLRDPSSPPRLPLPG